MSQDLYVSALDLSMFRAAMGSDDRKMLARILASRKDDIAGYDSYFARSNPPARPLALVIEEVITGKLLKGTPAWQYEGAVAQIADALGTPLHVEVLFEARAAFCLEVDRLIKDLRKRARIAATLWPSIDEIMKRGPRLKIPTDRSAAGQRLSDGSRGEADVRGSSSQRLGTHQANTPSEIEVAGTGA